MNLDSVPRLSLGCRLHPGGEALLIPEGALNLKGPAREVLARLDGKRSIAEIAADLLGEFPGVPAELIQQDVLALLERMQQRGVIRYEP
ncbi:pyrroloquinoline quinone biosynthesis peptide chaperone PqqD [Terriglobus saanensis]|uniref:Coenzyme PQQ synthesis D n=1 Tax=Terriglobus saanensis (strain ATCC BAA-1853 / DSM 23119 / SP1PR4) TaxID=401053 RepID=E8V7X7_TERSS|nr:pyrroloquinoline quinone biosynthesis peptide chaperone PqqD [Terriglobus saanensis]ADV82901.1 hypothetical protein AciPR4_2098 [Terriglobus saanensis SP1PR4]